jgi:hypothetical protein
MVAKHTLRHEELYRVYGVDFEERTVGLMLFDTADETAVHWARCENVTILNNARPEGVAS